MASANDRVEKLERTAWGRYQGPSKEALRQSADAFIQRIRDIVAALPRNFTPDPDAAATLRRWKKDGIGA